MTRPAPPHGTSDDSRARGRLEQHQRRRAARAVEQRQSNLVEPVDVDPGPGRVRVREEIEARDRMGVEDELARSQVPPHVEVGHGEAAQQERQGRQRRQQGRRQGSGPGAMTIATTLERFIRRCDNSIGGGLGLASSEDVTTFALVCRPRKIRRLRMRVCLLLAVAACGQRRASGAGPPAGPPPMPVQIEAVKSVPLRDATEYVGVLRSRQSVQIQPLVEGHVSKILVTSGDEVQPRAR